MPIFHNSKNEWGQMSHFFYAFPCEDDYEQKSKNSGKNLTNQKLENILIEWPILNCPKKEEV